MHKLTKVSIALACALAVTAVTAQTVQRDGKEVKPAQTRVPVQTAQAGGTATGGAAGGAAAGGVGTVGVIAAVAIGIAAVAAASSDNSTEMPVTHNP